LPLQSRAAGGILDCVDVRAQSKTSLDDVRHRVPKLGEATIDYGMLAHRTGFSLKLAWILGYALLMRAFGDSGITPQRFSMLELIGCNPGQQQIQLGNALGLSRSAATLTIDFWEHRGCIERRSDKNDRRSFEIYLTPQGEIELARLRELVLESDTALTSGLTTEETAELRRLLGKIHL
jgi:DNA-binding MarR family transcriptional regulator